MFEQLGQTQSKLYSRAVDPALESRLRVRDPQTPSPPDDVNVPASRAEQARHSRAQQQEVNQGRGQVEQRARDVAEHLSQSLRQAKQEPPRYRATFALATHTGRQASQSYLNGGQPKDARIVDELA